MHTDKMRILFDNGTYCARLNIDKIVITKYSESDLPSWNNLYVGELTNEK